MSIIIALLGIMAFHLSGVTAVIILITAFFCKD